MSNAYDPTVTTDQSDYAPGSEATFTATGFDPNSTIEFSVETQLAGRGYSVSCWRVVRDGEH